MGFHLIEKTKGPGTIARASLKASRALQILENSYTGESLTTIVGCQIDTRPGNHPYAAAAEGTRALLQDNPFQWY